MLQAQALVRQLALQEALAQLRLGSQIDEGHLSLRCKDSRVGLVRVQGFSIRAQPRPFLI